MTVAREWHEEIDSTQDRALELARTGADEGTRVVAARQRQGRGRLDHRWESPDGGVYLSIVLAAPREAAGLLPLGIGAGLADALRDRYSVPLALKWPNDLLVVDGRGPSRKLSGILIDQVASPRLGSAAVAGIGVNVTTDTSPWPTELRRRVATLAEYVAPPPALAEVEEIMVDAALGAAEAVRDPGRLDELRARCRRLLYGVGRRAEVDGHPVGRIRALGDDGALWVEDEGRRVAIRAGDLRVEEPG